MRASEGLRLDGLAIRQGGFALAADLAVAPGRRVAILGPSGAGKSTLLAAVAGFLRPDRGRVLWAGQDLTSLAPGARPVSVVFQDGNLFPHLTAFENVGLGLSPRLRLDADARARVEAVLDEVGLAGLGGRLPAALSGGQASRVALARLLLRDRPLALLDEPFAALGPRLRREMLDLLDRTVRRMGATLLLVTHDPGEAERIADDVIVVAEGRAAPPVPLASFRADPPAALRDYLD